MSTDLPTAIREALHADDITAADLRHPTLRVRARPVGRRVVSIAGAVVAVAAVAIALAVIPGSPSEQRPATGNGALSGVVGYRWRVTEIEESGTTPGPMPRVLASLHAEIDFTRDGYVLGNDTVNALQANYRTVPAGYTVRNAVSSAVGTAGMTPRRKRIVAAVDALFFNSRAGRPVTVQVFLTGNRLLLARGSVGIFLRRAGTQPDFFSQTSSPTPTRSG